MKVMAVTFLHSAWPIAGIVCGIALTATWIALIGFEFFKAIGFAV
jgi:hypothetical protein